MNKILIKCLTVFLLILISGCGSENEQLHLVTFNIRYASPGDGVNVWQARIPVVRSYFTEEMPDIIGMQEVLHSQIVDLQEMLPMYSYIGTGRDDGKQGGEYSPIFYLTDKFNLLDHSQFWLSETPDIPGSRSWDSAITRIVAWAKLEHKSSGKVFYCFNTHFDHRGVEARQRSADLMSQKITGDCRRCTGYCNGGF
jgi:endonuclease/exonuclease/phosphatase family metal-dependent hydrolase